MPNVTSSGLRKIPEQQGITHAKLVHGPSLPILTRSSISNSLLFLTRPSNDYCQLTAAEIDLFGNSSSCNVFWSTASAGRSAERAIRCRFRPTVFYDNLPATNLVFRNGDDGLKHESLKILCVNHLV